MRGFLGAGKLFLFLVSGLVTIAYQSVFLLFNKGPACLIYPRLYHAFLCRVLGLKITVEGTPVRAPNVVYVGNHISYMDIEAVGSLVHGSFVAKKEVETWPFFGILGKMQRTLYISRNPARAAEGTKMIEDRLREGMPVIVFPEGTSSNGTSILPFKSSFFEIFLNKNIIIQPFTISLLSVNGHPASNPLVRDQYTWHRDMTLEPHLWNFVKGSGADLKISFEEPISSASYNNRKSLSADAHEAVVKGLDLSTVPSYGHAS